MCDIRKVLETNPDTPVIVLSEAVYGIKSDGFDYYYLETVRASAERLLWPCEADLYGCCGLNYEKIYDDMDNAAEDMTNALYERWDDAAIEHGKRGQLCRLSDYCGFPDGDMWYMARQLSMEVIREQPWKPYVVIRASM